MKKTILLLTLSVIALSAAAQDAPRLRAIRDKQMNETIFPTQRKDKWGYANEKGKFLIKAIFEQADFFRDVHIDPTDTVTLARVKYEGKWGVLNRDGTFLLDPSFDDLKPFEQEVAIFKDKGSYGFISYTGEVVREGLQELEDFLPGGMAWYKENGRWGVLRTDGTDLFPSLYSVKPTENLSPSLLLTEVDGLFGIISLSKGKTILAPECDGIDRDQTDPSLLIFQRGGRLGCLLADGSLIAPPQYDSIASVSFSGNREILVKKNGRYGKLATTGKELIPPVLLTDQISSGQEICQFYRNGEPWLYYKGKPYSIQQFDDLIHENYNSSVYLSLTDNLRFPTWMRRHVFDDLEMEEGEARWRQDNPFHLFSEDGKYRQKKYVSSGLPSLVSVGKDLKILEYDDLNCSYDSPLSSVSIEVNGASFPIGNWLTTLFRTIDSKKIGMFDRTHGTSVLEDWTTVTFVIPAKTVSNGKLFLIADMYVDSHHAQRAIAAISAKGAPFFTIKEDGELYTENPVYPGFANLCLVDDQLLNTSLRGEVFSGTLYTAAGKKLISMNGFLPLYIFVSDSDYLFLGTTEDGAQMQRYGRNGALLKKDAGLQFVPDSPDSEIDPDWITVSEGRFLVSDRVTGLLRDLVNMDTPQLRTPVLRYTLTQWDGQPAVAVSKNVWDYVGGAQWYYVPGPGQRDGAFRKEIGDVQFNVSAETGDNGIGVYSVKYSNDGDESLRYGYIGFETPFFTAPVFEDAQIFSGGTANVKVHGEWLPMTVGELQKYASDPRGAIDPEVGNPIFVQNQ